MRLRTPAAFVLLGSLVAACTTASEDTRTAATDRLQLPSTSQLEPIGQLEMEETSDVLFVSPDVSPEDGGFLIVDAREAQARIYDEAGHLIRFFGRRGRGPGEFQRPMSGFRTPSGQLVVADLAAGLMRFDSTGLEFHESVRPPITPLYRALPLTDTLALLLGPAHASGSEPAAHHPMLLHTFDMDRGAILHSFFPMPGDTVTRQAARNFGWGDAALAGDTIVAVFALVDSIYYFDRTGRTLGKVQIPFSRFERIRSIPPEIRMDAVRRERWLEQHQFVNRVFPIRGNRLVIQYERPRGAGNEWGLVIMTRDGRRIEELADTPQLLAVRGDSLYFIDPASEVPNRWTIARIAD